MNIKVFDGAMGTMLQAAGIADKPCPEYACIISPDEVRKIHRAYVEAGADIIETNTFGGNPIKLSEFGLAERTEEINAQAVAVARSACDATTQVAGSVGPLGQLIAPLGELDFDVAVVAYERQIKALADAGVDYILIETLIDIQEMRAALLAAKAVCDLPVICQMSFEENARTVTGTDVVTMVKTLEPMGASVVGINCSLGPKQLLPLIEELAKNTNLPISVQPNAGMPMLVDGRTVFPLAADEMSIYTLELVKAGASYVGGCCGTTPEHIRALKQALEKVEIPKRTLVKESFCLTSRTSHVFIGHELSPVLIGERINPTGRKAMAAELQTGSLAMVKRDALAQVQAGARVLDVNMGVAGLDQKDLMRRVINELAMLVETPLCIDSTDPEVIEAGLRYYPGRALINSVSDNGVNMHKIFALAKKYGAAVILLPLSENNLPKTAEQRLNIARKLVTEGLKAGLSQTDFMLDALVMTVSTDGRAPSEVLESLRLYKQEFGYPTTMGLSNVSFGLPKREHINMAFYAAALTAGLTSPIINPLLTGIWDMTEAMAVILGQDSQGIAYSVKHSQMGNSQAKTEVNISKDIMQEISDSVLYGERERAVQLVREAAVQGKTLQDIANNALTVGMQLIGEKFSTGQAFLPQVLLAAESMRAAFDELKRSLPQQQVKSAGTVILATVQGDIHDLGKNIVAALLGNSGFKVIDLGKDVAPNTIIEAVKREKPDMVGLCALMTTTLAAMEQTVALLKELNVCGVMVGGAVVTDEYSRKIGADLYAADAIQAVNLAKKHCNN